MYDQRSVFFSDVHKQTKDFFFFTDFCFSSFINGMKAPAYSSDHCWECILIRLTDAVWGNL